MKTSSVRTPEFILLLLSIMCAGIFPSLQHTAQAKAQIPFSKREPKPGSVTRLRYAPAAQEDKSPSPNFRFTVEAGKSKPVTFPLGHTCKTLNNFSIKSGKKILQFEGPTDSLPFKPGSNILSARIDATKLKQGVYPVKVSLKCLDCKPPCGQTEKNLLVEITVIKPSAQVSRPAPQPAPPSPAKPSQGESTTTTEDAQEEQKLSEEGPQFPVRFNPSDFSYRAFVTGGSPLLINYLLKQDGLVTLTITTKNASFVYEFKGKSAGPHEELIQLPKSLGGPTLATYAIKAVSDKTPNAVLVPLVIYALAVGEKAIGSSGIDRLTITPPNIQIVRGRAATNASYSFHAVRSFSKAIASIRLLDAGMSEEVSRGPYKRNIARDEVVNGDWDCKKGVNPSIGLHVLFVKAWHTIQEGGAHVNATSLSQLVVRN